jgi:hypothetical protein
MDVLDVQVGNTVVIDSQMLLWFKERLSSISEPDVVDNEFLPFNKILSCLQKLSKTGIIETEEEKLSYSIFASIYY